jgi:hypothetical protein
VMKCGDFLTQKTPGKVGEDGRNLGKWRKNDGKSGVVLNEDRTWVWWQLLGWVFCPDILKGKSSPETGCFLPWNSFGVFSDNFPVNQFWDCFYNRGNPGNCRNCARNVRGKINKSERNLENRERKLGKAGEKCWKWEKSGNTWTIFFGHQRQVKGSSVSPMDVALDITGEDNLR